jgi:hypothetical protein
MPKKNRTAKRIDLKPNDRVRLRQHPFWKNAEGAVVAVDTGGPGQVWVRFDGPAIEKQPLVIYDYQLEKIRRD